MSSSRSVSIVAAGDTLSCMRPGYAGEPFVGVNAVFQDADFRFLNLETVLTERMEPRMKKQVCIRTDPARAEHLQRLGVDAVNLANNHALDFGEEGLGDTLNVLRSLGIGTVGAGFSEKDARQPLLVERNGLKVAVVGYFDYLLRCGDASVAYLEDRLGLILTDVEKLKRSNDIVVVSLHWGVEHVMHPSPAQAAFARSLVDAGASLVLGHHPHCVQGVERHGTGLIAYSLGCFNFWMFNYVRTRWFNRLSFVLKVRLDCSGVLGHELIPVWVGEDSAPRLISDPALRRRALRCFAQVSQDLEETTWREWYEEVGWMNVPLVTRSFLLTIPKYGLPRIKKFLWWLRRDHTKESVRGLLRAILKGKGPCRYRPIWD
jgi:hypothetical protein